MKKLLFLLLLIPLFINGQTIDGYWGLKLGQDIDSVKEYIATNGIGALVREDTSKLVYDHCVFGHDSVATVDLLFYTGKLYLGSMLIKGDSLGYKYNELAQKLMEKYGEPANISDIYMMWHSRDSVLSGIDLVNISSEKKVSVVFFDALVVDKKNESDREKLKLEYEQDR